MAALALVLCFVLVCVDASVPSSRVQTPTYEYYCIGNCNATWHTPVNTSAGYFVQGGGSDLDAGFVWMIERATHGNFLVMRASGSDAYNQWIWQLADGSLNSVATLIIRNTSAAMDANLTSIVSNADALFFAGGICRWCTV
jgi:cyanophycinase